MSLEKDKDQEVQQNALSKRTAWACQPQGCMHDLQLAKLAVAWHQSRKRPVLCQRC